MTTPCPAVAVRPCTVDPRLRPREHLRRLIERIERERAEEEMAWRLLPASEALMRVRDAAARLRVEGRA